MYEGQLATKLGHDHMLCTKETVSSCDVSKANDLDIPKHIGIFIRV